MTDRKQGYSVCIFSLKGGVGKTTIAHGLARGLMKKGHRVAFLDSDYNNPVSHLLFGIPHQRHKPLPDYSIAPIEWDGIQYASVAFLFSPAGATRQDASHRARALAEMCSIVRWQPHDFLVVDSAPSSSDENRSILKTLDPAVVVVVEGGPLAERGLERSIKFLTSMKASVLGILGNKGFDARSKATELEIPYLGTIPFGQDPVIDPDMILEATPTRLGNVSRMRRGRRSLVRAGLGIYLKVQGRDGDD